MSKNCFTAVLIEPRVHRALELVLDDFLSKLDDRWGFVIFHGTKNKDYLTNLIDKRFSIHKNRITMISLNTDNLSIQEYSKLLTHKWIYTYIPTEVFLIFQTDSLLSDKYYNNIYDFIKYDYVGAPWSHVYKVGNGGLSLRRKSKMLEIIDCRPENNGIMNEDAFFVDIDFNTYKPTFEEAKEFSVESVFSAKSVGVHKAWHHLSKDQLTQISEHIPKLFELIDLQD
jgi:hypothetical protein